MLNKIQSNLPPSKRDAPDHSAMQLDWELEECISQFESAWIDRGESNFMEFLPSADHPRFSEVAMELMRVDAELATRAGMTRNLKYYATLLPDVLTDGNHRQQLAFELSRLSMATPTQTDYPQVGETIAGFELLWQIGWGAFSRVYLAAENALSHRLVILKFSTKFPGEAATLARLQHKNIVPIYSWHRHNDFHVVCMPYLGATTLLDFLQSYRGDTDKTGSPHAQSTRTSSARASSALGQAIVSTVHNRRSQTLAEVLKWQASESVSQQSIAHATSMHAVIPEAGSMVGNTDRPQLDSGLSRETPRLLANQRSTETIVWIARELAAGLMHAHDRNVLHRDVKPANILIADDGTPMLLDFNLAVFERPTHLDSDVGGTPRYMAPEQLRSLVDSNVKIDARADLYALGVVLFELAVGENPFEDSSEPLDSAVHKLIDQRRRWSIGVAKWPRDLAPSLIEIIGKLLAFETDDRYDSAQSLYEDLERQLSNLPLKHARNRSLSERLKKWIARHPRLSSSAVVGSALGLVIAASIALLAWRQIEIDALTNSRWVTELEKAQLPAQAILGTSELPVDQMTSLLATSEKLVATPDVLSRRISKLQGAEKSKAQQLAGQLLTFRARGNFRLAEHERESLQRISYLDAALQDSQTADLFLTQGKSANEQLAKAIREFLNENSKQTKVVLPPIPREIIEQTQQLLGVDAANPWYWWLLGHNQFMAGEFESAVASAQVAKQIDASFPWSHYLMALIHMSQHKFALAESELTPLIDSFELDSPEIFMNRAICRLAQSNARDAQSDLDAIRVEADRYPRIHFLREQAYRMLGDRTAAERSLADGLATEPTEGHGYIARADAKLRSKPVDAVGALNDLQIAAEMLPNIASSYENQAYILSELQSRRSEAIDALTQGIDRVRNRASLYSSRATLYAREGNLSAARADVNAALQLDRSAMVCYQAASALLLASDSDADHALAMNLLKETLRKAPELKKTMETDGDLKVLRDSEQFKAVLEAAVHLQ